MANKWLLFCIFLAFILGLLILYYQHELTHAQIFKYYGCQNVRIKFDFNSLNLYTEADCFFTVNEFYEVRFLFSIVDIVGYHITGFYIALFPFLVLIILLLFHKDRNSRQYS